MRWILPLLLAAACGGWVFVARYYLPRGTWRIGPMIGCVVLALFAANEARWAHFENRLARAAAPVSGERGEFACERIMRNFFSSAGYAGHVQFDAAGEPVGAAFLSMGTCSAVKDLPDDPTNLHLITRAHVVTHEAAHLAGVRQEGAAECLAMEHDAAVFESLGLSADDAAAAAHRYRTEVFPRMPAEYQSGCTR